MRDKTRTEEFVSLILQAQPRLYGYILSLTANHDLAQDILQETNLVIWRKAEDFEIGTNFMAWAFRIALFQVKASRKRKQRDKLVFTDRLIEVLAEEVPHRLEDMQDRMKILRKCMNLLSLKQQSLLEQRYTIEKSAGEIAGDLGRSVASIHQTLYRIRVALMDCVGRARENKA